MAEGIVSLAHLVPCSEELDVNRHCDLVINTLYYVEAPADLAYLTEEQQKILGAKMHLDDLKVALDELVRAEVVIEYDGKYSLTSFAHREIAIKKRAQEEIQERVLDEWYLSEIIAVYGDKGEQVSSQLKSDLLQFVHTLFLRHGSSSLALIMSGDSPEGGFDIKSVLASLPQRETAVVAMREKAIPRFLSERNGERNRFLQDQLNKAVRYLTTVCDTKILDSLKDRLRDKKVYVDSSVLFRLLGLQGVERHSVMKTVVQLCRDFGITLSVHPMTYREMRSRIEHDSRVLRDYPVPLEMAAQGYQFIAQDNFVSTFWRWAKEKRVGSLDDYISYFSNLRELIENDGLVIDKPSTSELSLADERVISIRCQRRNIFDHGRREIIDHLRPTDN